MYSVTCNMMVLLTGGKQMKKKSFLALMLAVLMVLGLVLKDGSPLAVQAEGATDTIDVSIVDESQRTRVAPGDEFVIGVKLNGCSGVASLKLRIDFDKALTYQKCEYGDTFKAQATQPRVVEGTDSNHIFLTWDSLENLVLDSEAVIANVTFKVPEDAQPGTYSLQVSYDPNDVYKITDEYGGTENVTLGINGVTTNVNVEVLADTLALDKTSVTLKEGASTTLNAVVTPNNATASYEWTINSNIATLGDGQTSGSTVTTVSNSMPVTAYSVGTATITVTEKNTGKTATCALTVECNHHLEEHVASNPTCTSDGNSLYYVCNDCGKYYADSQATTEITDTNSVVIPATGHTWDEGVVTTAPTCTTKGVKTYTCTVCGETRTEDIAVVDHAWDEGVVTTQPTCTEKGVKTYTCTVGGETRTEDIAATGHTWDESVVTKEATCTENGVKTYTCTVCKETKTEEIAATGHTWDEGTVTKAATETEAGVKTYKCAACGDTKTEEIPALGNVTENTGSENNFTPSTGDSTDALLYMALALIAMASCAGACFGKRNKNRI